VVFLGNFVFFSQSGDHPQKNMWKNGDHLYEDLARSGYKPYMKYKTLTIPLFF
jgi:hypothetical protein